VDLPPPEVAAAMADAPVVNDTPPVESNAPVVSN
jgi:hypothetical protein